MKRYALFYFDDYYPNGGWGDFRGSFGTVEEAVAQASAIGEAVTKTGEWHVIDLNTGDEVKSGSWKRVGSGQTQR